MRRARAAAATALLLAAACGQIGGSSTGGGASRPEPTPPGVPIGRPASLVIGFAGGVVTSPDGLLEVSFPVGAVSTPTDVTVQPITNLAPTNVGLPAWLLQPEGTTFLELVTLTFHVPAGYDFDLLSVAWQEPQGYWLRVPPAETTRDPAARTLSVRTTHFSAWTLVTGPTERDLVGNFTLASTVDLPVTVAGTATFTFAGEGPGGAFYLLSGSTALPSPFTAGTATCAPVAPSQQVFELRTNVAEMRGTAPASFEWGTSAAWQTACDDGAARLVTVAFDNADIGYLGCARAYAAGTTPTAGLARAQGSYVIDCGARGTVTGTWDFLSSACGQPCATANPCRVAVVDCASGTPVCAETGNVADGTSCGTNAVCSGGTCAACTAGVACTPANPCHTGATSCATGTSTCVDSGTPLSDGTSCGTDQVCSAGTCVGCVADVACTPADPCHTGSTSCATGTSVCVDSGLPAANGTACGTDLVCYSGACIACTQGGACPPSGPCATAAAYECSTGAAVCTDQAFAPPGTSCGTGLVCDAAHACIACVQDQACTSLNPCAASATLECASGTPVCTDRTFATAGTACGSGQVCTAAGTCGACTAGASCALGVPCRVGVTDCSTGSPVCVDGGAATAGTSCGAGQVCDPAGACIACVQGSACASTNLCAATATLECASGVPTCTDRTAVPPGTGCGTDLVCNGLSCIACAQGAPCTSSDPCAATAAEQCATGTPVCAVQTYRAAGSSCGTNLVCSAGGVCVACTQDAACTSTNLCAASATYECSSGAPVCTVRTLLADGSPCGTNGTCNAGTCVQSRTVAGTRTVRYWPDAGAQAAVAAPDVGTASVAAVVSDGLGGWSTYPGTIAGSGAVSIASVPTGPFWLRFTSGAGATTYVDTTAAGTLDLGYDQLGRASAAKATLSTVATFTLSGLQAWTAGDRVQFASSNADVWDVLDTSTAPAVAVGALNLSRTADWLSGYATPGPQNLTATGDVLYAFQLNGRTDATGGNRPYQACFRSGTVPAAQVALSNGQPRTWAFNLTQPGSQRTLASAAWNTSLFEGYLAEMNVPQAGSQHSLVVGANVGTLTGNGPTPRGTPLLVTYQVAGGTASFTHGNLNYRRPLNTTLWQEWRGVDFTGSRSFSLSGATPYAEPVSLGRRDVIPVAAGAISPTLSPVRALALTATGGGSSPAYGDLTGTGLTPTITWSPPLTGTVTSYAVEVFRLGTSGGATTSTRVATFLTGATQVAIPSGVLAAGNVYYAKVTARSFNGDAFATAPFRRVVAGAWASAVTGTLQP